ncbi:epoxyqueuosine reductase QueH [Patescibacteria group bacterium]|nr:epoxyqueuosine reductase QueH [Patescibacteria group bacterium]
MKKLLLHTCCGPCALYIVQQLQKNYQVDLFFYNPNIYPESEYQRRLKEVRQWSDKNNLELIEGSYNHQEWLKKVLNLEKEPEGGLRCSVCFKQRLKNTAQFAKLNGYGIFATTLTISPHKNAELINQLGKSISVEHQIDFYEADWKKDDGFKHSCELAKVEGFYRQDYCGCEFSIRF